MASNGCSMAGLADSIDKLSITDVGLDGQNDASTPTRKQRQPKNKQSKEAKAMDKYIEDAKAAQAYMNSLKHDPYRYSLKPVNQTDATSEQHNESDHANDTAHRYVLPRKAKLRPQTQTVPTGPKVASPQQLKFKMDGWQHTDNKLHMLPRPVPTVAYLARASEPSQRTNKPRQLLIILDLNGTLGRKNSSGGFVHRMHVARFLRYVVTNYTVMIWSSAQAKNVQSRCAKLFDEVGLPVPSIIWDRAHFQLSPRHFKLNVQLYKELWRVWEDHGVQEAAKFREFDQSNTILIDDTAEKAVSEPYNLLQITEFGRGQEEFGELGQVVAYLEEAKYQSNVSAFMKDHPFTLDPKAAPYSWPEDDRQTDVPGYSQWDDSDDEHGGVKLSMH